MSDITENMPDPSEIKQPKRKRNILLIVGGILLCCCLSAGIAAVVFNTNDSQSPNRQETVNELDSVSTNEESEDPIVDQEPNEQDANETPNESKSAQVQEQSQDKDPTTEPTQAVPPTATPTETPSPSPTPLPIGSSRSSPFSPDETVSSETWEVQILDKLRGDDAWQLIASANQFNDPPPEGMEYLLISIHAKNISTGDEAQRISNSDFDVTGDKNILYSQAYISGPDPELNGELFTGGETEGWVSFLVGEGEENLVIVLDELFSFDEDETRYIALEEGASVSIDPALYDLGPSSIGLTRSEPAAPGETVATDEWELTITETMRGDDVFNMLLEVNQFNDPPEEGMTYLTAKVQARRIGTGDRALNISYSDFDPTGSANILHARPSIVGPDDELDAKLFPGGETEGWVVLQVKDDEDNLMVAYEPIFSFTDDDLRFLALDENASLEVPQEMSSISGNELGKEKSEPAKLGETIITSLFEFTVTEVIRGNEALALVQRANSANDPPDDGMEYVAIMMNVRNINPDDDWINISVGAFELTGDNGVIYDIPFVIEPEPRLDARLYPGGEFEGWSVYQAEEGESGLVLIYDTLFGIGERYFSLE